MPPPSNSPTMADAPDPDVILAVPEIRDYEQINKELTRRLSEGARRVVLAGVEGQRLLASGLTGGWTAVIEVQGRAGPELAAGLNAPRLTIVCRGDTADGAGSRLTAGRLVIEGKTDDGLGYAQSGGTILVMGNAGHRAGLRQSGGILVVLGSVGRLAGELQSGGILATVGGRVGAHFGRGSRGGRRLSLGVDGTVAESDRALMGEAIEGCGGWLPARFGPSLTATVSSPVASLDSKPSPVVGEGRAEGGIAEQPGLDLNAALSQGEREKVLVPEGELQGPKPSPEGG